MHECLLCGRNMKKSRKMFGSGCIKNLYELYFGINKAEISIKGVKINDKWNLKIHLHDRYDYSQFKDLKDYYKDTSTIQKSIFSSTLYNLAFFSTKFGVMKEYEIDIYFDINEYEVI